MKKICIGMFRPLYEDLRKRIEETEGSYWFSCRCSDVASYHLEALVDHWLKGHFDEPVYKEIDDSNPKSPEQIFSESADGKKG